MTFQSHHSNYSQTTLVSFTLISKSLYQRWTLSKVKPIHTAYLCSLKAGFSQTATIIAFLLKILCHLSGQTGGEIVYVRDTLSCKRRIDLKIQDIECFCVELQVKSKRVLLYEFYRPPNSNSDYFYLIKESVDRACNTNMTDIIINMWLQH